MFNYRERDHQEYKNRSGRFFQQDGEWYLQTRESVILGPFESHAEAAVCLNEYLDFINNRKTSRREIEEFYKSYAA